MGRAKLRIRVLASVLLVGTLALPSVPQASARTGNADLLTIEMQHRIRTLFDQQLEQLGLTDDYFPFLRDDAEVETGRELFGDPAPDLNGDGTPEVLETDLRYSYSVGSGQQFPPTVSSESDTRITVRDGLSGDRLWRKRFDRDAFPFAMRLGAKGRQGVIVLSGLWNYFGTTEESTIRFDAYEGKKGKHLWTREYTSTSYYELVTSVTVDGLLVIARFDAIKGRADDLMVGLATRVDALLTSTMATRVVVIDGSDGSERAHPTVDVGVDWWPIPLPTKDLDDDGLDDYATTNRLGIDIGEGQQGPTFGGTIYTRKGIDGTPIWTTSGIDMELIAFPIGLPDVVGPRTPEVGLVTLVLEPGDAGLLGLPLLQGSRYVPRVYLFDGGFGTNLWHRESEWIHSPGDVDRKGKKDLFLLRYRIYPKKDRTDLEMRAVTGMGHAIWRKHSKWHFDVGPCLVALCSSSHWSLFDFRPDFQADGIDDLLFGQQVRRNQVFEDAVTRAIDVKQGGMRFETEEELRSVGTAVDGHGTDLMADKLKNNQIEIAIRDGNNRLLWDGLLVGPDRILPRSYWLWVWGFELPGDSCGDLVITGGDNDTSFYGVFDGASGKLLWARSTAPRDEWPRFVDRQDRNDC